MAPRRAAGFTLVELIVVLGIFSVVSLLAYGGLASVLNSRVTVQAAIDRTAAFQKAFFRLRDDLQQVRERPVRNSYGTAFEPALWLNYERRLEFTRGGWRNPLSHPRSTMERVAYRLDDDRQLVRDSWRVLDRGPDSPVVSVVLLDRVRQAEWRFLDDTRQWHPEWPPPANVQGAPQPAPMAVELTLETDDWGELRLLFKTR